MGFYFVLLLSFAEVPGKSVCLGTLEDSVLFPPDLSWSSVFSIISSRVPSSTSRRNLPTYIEYLPDLHSCIAPNLVSSASVLTILPVLMVLGSCSSPYILLSRALFSSTNLSIASLG